MDWNILRAERIRVLVSLEMTTFAAAGGRCAGGSQCTPGLPERERKIKALASSTRSEGRCEVGRQVFLPVQALQQRLFGDVVRHYLSRAYDAVPQQVGHETLQNPATCLSPDLKQ